VSDVHLGSRFCRYCAFVSFLGSLPDGDALVLNGDTLDRSSRAFMARHRSAIDLIRQQSEKRQVTWIRGNNDAHFQLPDAPAVRYVDEQTQIEGCLVCHGHEFEPTFRRNPLLVVPVKAMYWAYRLFSGKPIHAAAFAKLLRTAYLAFCSQVAAGACAEAARLGVSTVICGHTHMPEDRVVRGIRYINTGCWTETEFYAAVIDSEGPALRRLSLEVTRA
jgi:UDP-2,3-diacylglucosamine pyrophosphatase LpxH